MVATGTATAWPRGSPPGCPPWASTRCSLNSNKDQTVLLLSFHSRAWTDQRCPAKCMEAHVEYSTFCRLSSMTTGYKRHGQSPPERPDLGDTPAPTPQVTAQRPGEPSPPRSGRGPRGGRQVGPRPPRPRAGPGGLWARVSALRTGAAGTSRPGGSDAQRGGPRAAGVLPSPPRPVRSGRQVGSAPRGSPARAWRLKRKRKRRRGARRLPTTAAPRPAPPWATRARRGAGCGALGYPGRRPRGAGGGALLTRSRAAPPATPTGRQSWARAGGAVGPAVRAGGARGAGRGGQGPGAAPRACSRPTCRPGVAPGSPADAGPAPPSGPAARGAQPASPRLSGFTCFLPIPLCPAAPSDFATPS